MKKRVLSLVAALVLSLLFCGFTYQTGSYVYDNTSSISDPAALNNTLQQLGENIKADVVIEFTDTPSDPDYMQEAKNELLSYVSKTGGYGKNGEAILLYVDLKNRHFAVVEHSSGKYLLKDSEIDRITDPYGEFTARMSQGDYDGACQTFIAQVADYAKPGFFETFIGWLTTALGLGGAATGAAVGSHKSRAKVSKRVYLNKSTFGTLLAEDELTGTTAEVREIHREESQPSHVESGDLGNDVHGGGGSF